MDTNAPEISQHHSETATEQNTISDYDETLPPDDLDTNAPEISQHHSETATEQNTTTWTPMHQKYPNTTQKQLRNKIRFQTMMKLCLQTTGTPMHQKYPKTTQKQLLNKIRLVNFLQLLTVPIVSL
ncbi:uncharacterized protein LOC127854242 isoform X1 [Dreissena polymorpha]|uniref:uncharacterized protein LOC127854242 isoform X1 n=1 Tax=Dreissena polymorpha TaxID=45954 RepID=UPI0022654F9A|nr:uncharacterized protein LOC127854242 isoform X1 [Dreissena polymorpha]